MILNRYPKTNRVKDRSGYRPYKVAVAAAVAVLVACLLDAKVAKAWAV